MSLSVDEFTQRYAMTHTPVIITGMIDCVTTTPWTLQHVRQIAGT